MKPSTALAVAERSPIATDKRVSQREVCRLLGDVSPMTLWRWRHDPTMNFPKPAIEINGRNYYALADILNWKPPKKTGQSAGKNNREHA